MSKFKVGDRVRKVGSDYLDRFALGEELTIIDFSSLGNAVVENSCGDNDTAYDSDLELISSLLDKTLTLSGTTYTLTPYEAPKLVTIDGVVYVMTEVV